jgi:hypothetical protein
MANAMKLPQDPGVIDRLEARYNRVLRAMLEPSRPGEKPVPDISEFLQKRSQLQNNQTKEAATIGSASKAAPIAGKLLDKLFTTKGMLVGGSLIGLGAIGEPVLKRFGESLQRKFYPNIISREELDEEAAASFAKETGKQVAQKTVNLFADMLSKAVALPSKAMQSRAQRGVFGLLQQEDDVLSQADPQQLSEAYHTMVRFAPTLATDKNAVKTFLRESVLYGTGPNHVAIKQLAETERAVNPPPMPRK